MNEVARRSGDEDFGLHAAERLPRGALDILEYATDSCERLGEGIARTARYLDLVNSSGEVSYAHLGDVASFWHRDPQAPRHMREMLFASMVLRSRELTGSAVSPVLVSFMHPRPATDAEHRRIFAAPVRFDQPIDELLYDGADMSRPILRAEPRLSAILDGYAEAMLARLPNKRPLITDVCRSIVAALPGRDLSLAGIAARMGTSGRTLHRRLRAEGTSHRELVNHVRHGLALFYLRKGRMAQEEIAFLLGLSDRQAFRRAFRRWTGTTPGAFTPGGRARGVAASASVRRP